MSSVMFSGVLAQGKGGVTYDNGRTTPVVPAALYSFDAGQGVGMFTPFPLRVGSAAAGNGGHV